MYLQLGLMGMEFEVKKKYFPTHRPIPEKQEQKYFKVGPIHVSGGTFYNEQVPKVAYY